MVSRDYLLKKPPPPSRPKVFLDQQIIPRAIDLAGEVEAAFERVAIKTRETPGSMLALAFGLGVVLPFAFASWRGLDRR